MGSHLAAWSRWFLSSRRAPRGAAASRGHPSRRAPTSASPRPAAGGAPTTAALVGCVARGPPAPGRWLSLRSRRWTALWGTRTACQRGSSTLPGVQTAPQSPPCMGHSTRKGREAACSPAHLHTSPRAGGRGPPDRHTDSPGGAQGTGGRGGCTDPARRQRYPLGAKGTGGARAAATPRASPRTQGLPDAVLTRRLLQHVQHRESRDGGPQQHSVLPGRGPAGGHQLGAIGPEEAALEDGQAQRLGVAPQDGGEGVAPAAIHPQRLDGLGTGHSRHVARPGTGTPCLRGKRGRPSQPHLATSQLVVGLSPAAPRPYLLVLADPVQPAGHVVQAQPHRLFHRHHRELPAVRAVHAGCSDDRPAPLPTVDPVQGPEDRHPALGVPPGLPKPPSHGKRTALAPSTASPAPYLAAGYTVSCSGATSFPSTLT